MKIDILRPKERSLERIQETISDGLPIRRSPHVGNVRGDELMLIFGLADMGASVELKMVDTIHGNDNYSKPRYINSALGTITLASLKSANYRVVGACQASAEGVLAAQEQGFTTALAGSSLADIHMEALARVLPGSVAAEPSSQYFRSVGVDVLKQCVLEAAKLINRPARRIDNEGKIRTADNIDVNDMFGMGENPLSGTLPSLEAVLALEIVDSAIKANGCDSRVTHVAGNDMARYTSDPELIGIVKAVAVKVAGRLALPASVVVEYCLPTRSDLLASSDFPRILPESGINSQYDIVCVS